ncbi:MAG TPA: hypothetical protein VF011_04180 [Terriglobales bacterium]
MPVSTEKRVGTELPFKTFTTLEGKSLLVFRTSGGEFHVFKEVEAKEAAKQCGADPDNLGIRNNTRDLWEYLWEKE